MKLFVENNEQGYETLLDAFKMLKEGQYTIEIKKTRHTRTSQQQAAIELYCKMCADYMNDSGISKAQAMQVFKKEQPWCQESFKEIVFREMQSALGWGRRTSGLTTEQVSKVYEWCNLFTAKLGFSTPFPSRDDLKWM